MIELPRWVHRDGSSCLVETVEGLREAEAEGWRVNPNEPDVCHAEPVDEAAERALLVELAETLKAEAGAETAPDASAAAQDDAGEAGGATSGEDAATDDETPTEADDKPRRKAGKKR